MNQSSDEQRLKLHQTLDEACEPYRIIHAKMVTVCEGIEVMNSALGGLDGTIKILRHKIDCTERVISALVEFYNFDDMIITS